MKYVILLSVLISGCSLRPDQPITFTCLTAFGPTQFRTDDSVVKLEKETLKITKDGKTYTIFRSMCVEETGE